MIGSARRFLLPAEMEAEVEIPLPPTPSFQARRASSYLPSQYQLIISRARGGEVERGRKKTNEFPKIPLRCLQVLESTDEFLWIRQAGQVQE